MPVRKDRSGRWRATLKNGREYVTSKTFDTKREADGWLSREKAALAGGTDPRAGEVVVRSHGKLPPRSDDSSRGR